MFPSEPSAQLPHAPMPADGWEYTRWEETRRRRRLLDGTWAEDYRQRRREHLGTQRNDAVGPTSLVFNAARNLCSELSVLYGQEPSLYQAELGAAQTEAIVGAYRQAGLAENNLSPEAAYSRAQVRARLKRDRALPLDLHTERIANSGLWSQMDRLQRYVLACREFLVRPTVRQDGKISYREVPPDQVLAVADPEVPSVPVLLAELRPRMLDGHAIWTWDTFDLRQPAEPKFQIRLSEDGKIGEDITGKVLDKAVSGDAYPFRFAAGDPFIPHEIYHAHRAGDRVWDPFTWTELMDGTLDLAVLYAFLIHIVRDASWPQRYIANLEVCGLEVETERGIEHAELVTDPATVVQLRTPAENEGQGQPLVGQWEPGGDPVALDAVISNLVQRLALDVGVSLSDVQRVSDAARSGVAISLTNEGKRAAQRRYAPHFRPSDVALVEKTTAMLNRATGAKVPETGWELEYQALPLSPDELAGRRQHVLDLREAGLISQQRAYQEIWGGSSAQAIAALAEIRSETPSAPR